MRFACDGFIWAQDSNSTKEQQPIPKNDIYNCL